MRRLPPLLRRAWYSLNQVFRHRIAPLGITPDQYSILRWLSESPAEGLTQSDITDLMASDPNTIAAIVRRMETAGLVIRPTHEKDRRAKRVQIQTSGNSKFIEAHSIAIELQKNVLNDLTAAESEQFLKLLEKVANACARQATGHKPT
jgi:DNA-binding MarR family transcriptional regulator